MTDIEFDKIRQDIINGKASWDDVDFKEIKRQVIAGRIGYFYEPKVLLQPKDHFKDTMDFPLDNIELCSYSKFTGYDILISGNFGQIYSTIDELQEDFIIPDGTELFQTPIENLLLDRKDEVNETRTN